MKCPKCGYLGFEAVDRCRNCGYDFSFTPPTKTPDLSIRFDDSDSTPPLGDLPLVEPPASPPDDGRASRASGIRGQTPGAEKLRADLRRDLGDPLNRAARSDRNRDVVNDLPLFGMDPPDDVPLITRASPPRQPLSVRRGSPEVPRQRSETRPASATPTPMLDLGSPGSYSRSITPTPQNHQRGARSSARLNSITVEPAGVAARLLAVVVDVLVLAVTDVAVIFLTLKICGLGPDDLGLLPKGPLIAFLIVENGGYLVAFTAGGQTLGKLIAGIRVVSSEPGGSVDLGHSVVRTVVWGLLAIPAGLGFVTALFNRDRRGLHDRCAGTRVVRAAA